MSDYESQTRRHYQDEIVAREYVAEYEGPFRLRHLSQRLVALGERRAIRSLLLPVAGELRNVADIPCGTGKLHRVLRGLRTPVVAADISAEMMWWARRSYQGRSGPVRMVRLDAARLPFESQSVDAVICLRFLHRVPPPVKSAVLRELLRVARRHVIVSLGVTGTWQRLRLRIRRFLTGVQTVPYPVSPAELHEYLTAPGWRITGSAPVLPMLSAEVVFRLTRDFGAV